MKEGQKEKPGGLSYCHQITSNIRMFISFKHLSGTFTCLLLNAAVAAAAAFRPVEVVLHCTWSIYTTVC